jgi:hypothetical protein
LFVALGKKRIIPTFKPSIVKLPISPMTDITVVAIPTFSGLYNLAVIIQKKKPKKAIIAALSIR